MRDADRATEATYGDVAREHALEDVDDEQRALYIEAPALGDCLCEGEATDLLWWACGDESQAVLLGAIADGADLGLNRYGLQFAGAFDLKCGWLTALVFEIGEKRCYVVECKDLVSTR